MNSQYTAGIEEVRRKIEQGASLFLAGDEKLLRQLPKGGWVGGTIPYFIAEEGGVFSRDRIQVFELPPFISGPSIKTYGHESIFNVYKDAPDNGFSLIIIPASSKTHLSFALNAPMFDNFAVKPLLGWISGVALGDLGKIKPKVYNGMTGEELEDGAVVMHASLPPDKAADVGIINIFEQDPAGDTLVFTEDSFSAKTVYVNGKERVLSEYIREKSLDTKLPLVANYSGAMVNISFQTVDHAANEVTFYAPVFKGVEYRHARPVGDYIETFSNRVSGQDYSSVRYSCNCILNYLYAGLEGRKTAGMTGPITFGEVAYQLLNQTLVYLKIEDMRLADRLRSESVLKQRFHLLETLLNTIPNPVYYKDLQGKYTGCNLAYERFIGRPKEKIIGKTIFDLLDRETAEFLSLKDEELLRHPGQQSFTTKARNSAGEWRELHFTKTTLTDPNGKVIGLIGVASDQTDRKKAEERLSQSLKLAAVGQLASGVAHEINNPLTGILGFSQVIKRELGRDHPLSPCADNIEHEALRCKKLVGELLTFSRQNSQDFMGADLNMTIESALSLVETVMKTGSVEIIRDYGRGIPAVTMNPSQVQQVIINLCNNATDAMQSGGKIVVTTRLKKGKAVVTFSDTGEGMDEEVRLRVFDPFFTTKPVGKGTGLGLNICYEIIRKHSGTISVDSEPGRGTTFTIELPV